ncbi:MAG: hypothetical protein J3Q66DRAFT_431648 [Benniella sp.]|nr:MAG: hypothetical protein J3Q66DRAFT_431648 [Benniella sp.]
MTSTACSRAFNIPELVDLFAPYLSPADILACVQVNTQWNNCFIPKLWHTIDDCTQSWEQILCTCYGDPADYTVKFKLVGFKPSSFTDGKDENGFDRSSQLRISCLNDETIHSLGIYCKKLEVLEKRHHPWYISGPSKDAIDPLYRLLLSCPSLRICNWIERFVRAEDLIREPWACQGIEKLRFLIVGVERLTNVEQALYDRIIATHPEFENEDIAGLVSRVSDEERVVIQKFRRSREQQHQIYERLASLKHLKHLYIGYECRYPWNFKNENRYISEFDGEEYTVYGDKPMPDTLELSLESGLGTLKDLEMIGFEGNDHRIDKKELEWMATSWPKLKLM